MDKMTPGDAFWLGLLAIVAGPLMMWFPFSDFEIAHRLMSGSDTVMFWKFLGAIVVGWGYIGWGLGAFIGSFLECDDFERYSFAMFAFLFGFC